MIEAKTQKGQGATEETEMSRLVSCRCFVLWLIAQRVDNCVAALED